MGYQLGLVLEVKGRTKLTKEYVEYNYILEYEEEINNFDFSLFDKRTLTFTIKRKGYGYNTGYQDFEIEKDDEAYEWAVDIFGTTHGKFTQRIIDIYINLFF